MKDKIKSYMNYLGVSAAQLADKIGVQRSSFSHILNGRNKPSADFISKLLEVYPDLNANWLLGNADNMLLSQRTKNKVPDLFSFQEAPLLSRDDKANNVEEKLLPETYEKKLKIEAPAVVKEKMVQKIIVFYDDFSFVEYKPQQDNK